VTLQGQLFERERASGRWAAANEGGSRLRRGRWRFGVLSQGGGEAYLQTSQWLRYLAVFTWEGRGQDNWTSLWDIRPASVAGARAIPGAGPEGLEDSCAGMGLQSRRRTTMAKHDDGRMVEGGQRVGKARGTRRTGGLFAIRAPPSADVPTCGGAGGAPREALITSQASMMCSSSSGGQTQRRRPDRRRRGKRRIEARRVGRCGVRGLAPQPPAARASSSIVPRKTAGELASAFRYGGWAARIITLTGCGGQVLLGVQAGGGRRPKRTRRRCGLTWLTCTFRCSRSRSRSCSRSPPSCPRPARARGAW